MVLTYIYIMKCNIVSFSYISHVKLLIITYTQTHTNFKYINGNIVSFLYLAHIKLIVMYIHLQN